jgi:hypothetical protein
MPNNNDYICPRAAAPDAEKITFVEKVVAEGESFLQQQSPYGDIQKSLDIMRGKTDEKIPEKLSKVSSNRLKRQVREIVASMANLRPMWGYKSDNPRYEEQAQVLNRLILGWWHHTFADRKIREALQYAAVCGTGYLSPRWEKDFMGIAGRGDIELDVLAYDQVIPYQLPHDNDLQKAYAVAIKRPTPINVARAMYPEFADLLQPDRARPRGMKKGLSKVQRFLSPVLTRFGLGGVTNERETNFPEVDVINLYVRDTSINTSGHRQPMGMPGTSWYYEVPSLGDEVPTGERVPSPDGAIDPATGGPLMLSLSRPATYEDCRLYPNLRLITCTSTCVLYDGPSYWWHGKVPVVQFRLDDWPWDFLGSSVVKDGIALQESNTSLLRAIDDAANARLRPPMRYDENSVSQSLMTRFDPRQGGQTIGVNMAMGNPIEPVLPAEFYDVPDWLLQHVKDNEARIDYLMGVQDMTALAKARQTPAADTVEKIQEMAGPLLTDMSRNMERSLRDLGDMVKAHFFQFYHTSRRIQLLGADGVLEEDFYFEPGDMVPSHLPGEDATAGPSRANLMERARYHQSNFIFHITPGSMHEITQMSRKMFYMQLSRNGFPLSPWTQGDVYNIPNMGQPPEDAKNEIDKFFAYQKMTAEFQLKMQLEAAQIQQAAMAAMAPPQMIAGAAAHQGGVPGDGGNPGPGRKPSGQTPPHQEIRNNPDGSQRVTTSESR